MPSEERKLVPTSTTFDLNLERQRVDFFGSQIINKPSEGILFSRTALGKTSLIEKDRNSEEIKRTEINLFDELIKYFNNEQGILSLNKGLMFVGGVGSCKTATLKVMHKTYGFKKPFRIVKCDDIGRDAIIHDKPTVLIDTFGRHSYKKTDFGHCDLKKPLTVMFDDLGTEPEIVKHFGNDIEILATIIRDRSSGFDENGMITHITTNLEFEQIEKKYGLRCRDRLRQMCNIIHFEGKSKR